MLIALPQYSTKLLRTRPVRNLAALWVVIDDAVCSPHAVDFVIAPKASPAITL